MDYPPRKPCKHLPILYLGCLLYACGCSTEVKWFTSRNVADPDAASADAVSLDAASLASADLLPAAPIEPWEATPGTMVSATEGGCPDPSPFDSRLGDGLWLLDLVARAESEPSLQFWINGVAAFRSSAASTLPERMHMVTQTNAVLRGGEPVVELTIYQEGERRLDPQQILLPPTWSADDGEMQTMALVVVYGKPEALELLTVTGLANPGLNSHSLTLVNLALQREELLYSVTPISKHANAVTSGSLGPANYLMQFVADPFSCLRLPDGEVLLPWNHQGPGCNSFRHALVIVLDDDNRIPLDDGRQELSPPVVHLLFDQFAQLLATSRVDLGNECWQR